MPFFLPHVLGWNSENLAYGISTLFKAKFWNFKMNLQSFLSFRTQLELLRKILWNFLNIYLFYFLYLYFFFHFRESLQESIRDNVSFIEYVINLKVGFFFNLLYVLSENMRNIYNRIRDNISYCQVCWSRLGSNLDFSYFPIKIP